MPIFPALDGQKLLVVEGSGCWGRLESDSQVFCHPNSLHAWWHVNRDMTFSSRPHHHHSSSPPPLSSPLPSLQMSVPTLTRARDLSSGEHVHSCCVLDVTLVELFPSRNKSVYDLDGSSVFLLTLSSACYCRSLKIILIVTIACSTDLDDSADIHTTCLERCVCRMFLSFVQPACLLEHGAHGMRSGRYLLFVEVFPQEWTESISGLE